MVFRQLGRPENALGEKLGGKFREGDYRWERRAVKITKILYYPGKNPYRYLLNGIKNASFSESQLKAAEEDTELFEVRQLLEKKVINGKVNYLTWYYDELKKEASWQPEIELNKFVPHLVILNFWSRHGCYWSRRARYR